MNERKMISPGRRRGRECSLLDNLDAGSTSGLVTVRVLLASAVVGDHGTLDIHIIRASIVVSVSTCPLAGALGEGRVATSPNAKRHSHGCLWVASSAVGISREQCPNETTINPPLQLLRGPDGGVVVIIVMYAGQGMHGAIGIVLNTLAKVVTGSMRIVRPQELPVHLVEIITQPHHGADDSLARSSLEPDLGAAPEEVELGADGGGVALLVDCECGTVDGVEVDVAGVALPEVARDGLVEVEVVGGAEGRICWAVCLFHGVAVGGDLCRGEASRQGDKKAPRQHREMVVVESLKFSPNRVLPIESLYRQRLR